MKRTTTSITLAVALAALGLLAPAIAQADGATPRVTCERGERATYPGGESAYARPPLVLGCVELPDGDRLQIEGRPVRSGDGVESSCFSFTFEPQPTGSFACPRHPPRGRAPRLYFLLHVRAGAPVLAIGAAPARPRSIIATATTPRSHARTAAELLRVSDRLGRRIAAPRGFALFVAPLPARTDPCAGVTLHSAGAGGHVTTSKLPGPERASFMSLPHGGWIGGLTYSWGIGGGAPRKCGHRAGGDRTAMTIGVATIRGTDATG